jgi:hypothetical protein
MVLLNKIIIDINNFLNDYFHLYKYLNDLSKNILEVIFIVFDIYCEINIENIKK